MASSKILGGVVESRFRGSLPHPPMTQFDFIADVFGNDTRRTDVISD